VMATQSRPEIAAIHEFNHELVTILKRLGAIEVATEESNPLWARSLLRNVTWTSYRSFQRAILRKGLRHSYRAETLELMAPRTFWRESRKSIVRRFAQHLSSELEVKLTSLGRAPIVSSQRGLGLEPDESFTIAGGRWRRREPNLIIEVIDGGPESKRVAVEEQAISRMRVLRELGVFEVWLVHGESVTICANQQRRRWKRRVTSQFFPGVTSAILSKHLAGSRRVGENDSIRGLLYDVSKENGKNR
jgi:Uma2 family endonuclease